MLCYGTFCKDFLYAYGIFYNFALPCSLINDFILEISVSYVSSTVNLEPLNIGYNIIQLAT